MLHAGIKPENVLLKHKLCTQYSLYKILSAAYTAVHELAATHLT